MGYTTTFSGELNISPALNKQQIDYLQKFNKHRRMKRDAKIAEDLNDPIRIAVGLPIGDEGAYYVGSEVEFGQERDKSIINYNEPPGMPVISGDFFTRWDLKREYIDSGKCQPGLWCQWTVTDDGTQLEWDGGEKFYEYVAWLKYLITHFFELWGAKINGEIFWQGEESDDMGKIEVINNTVIVKNAKITYE